MNAMLTNQNITVKNIDIIRTLFLTLEFRKDKDHDSDLDFLLWEYFYADINDLRLLKDAKRTPDDYNMELSGNELHFKIRGTNPVKINIPEFSGDVRAAMVMVENFYATEKYQGRSPNSHKINDIYLKALVRAMQMVEEDTDNYHTNKVITYYPRCICREFLGTILIILQRDQSAPIEHTEGV